jgi:hypothetical protein
MYFKREGHTVLQERGRVGRGRRAEGEQSLG